MRTILVVLLLAVSANAQDFKFLPWKYDRWNSTDGFILKSDKAEHAIRDGAIFWALGKTNLVGQYRFGVTTLLATGWEIRDGFKGRKTGGFSWKDLFAGMAGQIVVFGAEQLFDKPKKKQAYYDNAVRKETEGLAINPILSVGDIITNEEKFLCQQCKAKGLTSRVYPGSISSTLAYSQPFYDEAGKFHNHDTNVTTYSFSCSNGHKWESHKSGKCWCGWPNQ